MKADPPRTANRLPRHGDVIQVAIGPLIPQRQWPLYGPWMALPVFVLFYAILAVLAWFLPGALLRSPMVSDVWTTGLPYAFVCLLGIWVGLGPGALWYRLAWSAGGVCYCGAMVLGIYQIASRSLGPDHFVESGLFFLCVFSPPALAVALVLHMVRRCRAKLTSLDEIDLPREDAPIRLSIRGILGTLVAAALVFAVGQGSLVYDFTKSRVFFAAAVDILAALVALASVWAILGTRNPLLPVLGIILMGAFLGGSIGGFGNYYPLLRWPAIAIVETTGIVGPLFIVRSFGYRLARPAVTREGRDAKTAGSN